MKSLYTKWMATMWIGVLATALCALLLPPSAEAQRGAAANTVQAGATFDPPEGWRKSTTGNVVSFTAPEEDAALVIVPVPSAGSAEAAAAAAWKIHDPVFSRSIRLNSPEAADKGWDVLRSIEYETSPSEEKLAYAYVHGAGESWQVVLLDGHLGTIAKRSAAVRSVLQSFSLDGYVPEDLADREAKELSPERVASLKQFVADSARTLSIPGIGFALIQNGNVVFEGGVGVKTHGSDDPVDRDTLFMIASNTKGMTTLLLAKLVEMGKVNWDDRVIDHYPAFKLGDQRTTESVLIRHLVCACTGLPRKDLDWIFNNTPTTPASRTFDDLAATEPTSGFGELYQYNNQMAAAAGYVAGHVLYPDMEIGAAYDKAMRFYIFDPLGMTDTTMSIARAMRGNYATPHVLNMDGDIETVAQTADRGFNHLVTAYRPAGAAWSSPHEMIKYIRNELTEGVGADGERLFAAEPLLERRKPVVPAGKNRTYGMGLANRIIAGVHVVEHGGSMAGFKSQIVIIPGANTGAVILTNSDEGGALLAPFGRRLVEILYDGEEKAAQQVAVAAEVQQLDLAKLRQELTVPADPETVAGLAKRYHNDELGPLDLRRNNGETILDPGVWSSGIATKRNPDGTASVALTNGAMLGLEAVVGQAEGKRTLTVIAPQRRYVFTEVDEGE